MIFLNTLRMIADVAFYGALAGFVSALSGGSGAFFPAMIQCLCFGLSCLGKQNRFLRLTFLLPMIWCWILCKDCPADCILLIPTAIYIIRLVWKNDYVLEHYRQKRLFPVFGKVILVFSIAASLAGCTRQILAVTLPYGAAMLAASILLLRTLRHDPAIYRQKTYQLINVSTLLLVTAAAYALSSRTLRKGYVSLLIFLQRNVFQPILELLLSVFLAILSGIFQLLSFLPFVNQLPAIRQPIEITAESADQLLGNYLAGKESSMVFHMVFCAVFILIAILILTFLFRWLNKRSGHESVHVTGTVVRETTSSPIPERKERSTSSVRKIRTQYRELMKWCNKNIRTPKPDTTSLDIHKWLKAETGLEETSAQIRNLYLHARYADKASPKDAQDMKDLCGKIKKTSL